MEENNGRFEDITPAERSEDAAQRYRQQRMAEMNTCPVCGHLDALSTFIDKPDFDTLGMCFGCAELGRAELARQDMEG